LQAEISGGQGLGIEAVPVSWIEALNGKEILDEMVTPLIEKYLQVSENKFQFSEDDERLRNQDLNKSRS